MNKKFLMTIAMIMSLVMAISCGDNNPADPGNGDPKPVTPEHPDPQLKTFKSITLSPDATQESKAIEMTVGTAKNTSKEVTGGLTFTVTGADGDSSFSDNNITYTISGFENVKASVSTSEVALDAVSKNTFTYDKGTKNIKIANGTELTKGTALTSGKFDMVKLTITVSLDGYNPATKEVYLKLKAD